MSIGPRFARYGLPVLSTAAALLARLLMDPVLGIRIPYATFYIAVAASALLGGSVGGTIATALSAIAAVYFFVPPRNSILVSGADNQLGFALYLVVSAIIVYFAHLQHRATRRLKEEVALREQWESAERLQRQRFQVTLEAVMEHIPEGLAIVDAKDLKLRMMSRHGAEMFGRSREELEGTAATGLPALGIYHSDGRTQASPEELPVSGAVLRGEITTGEEWVIKRPDGEAAVVLCDTAPIRDSGDRIAGALMACRNITSRKQAEEALRESEERFRVLMTASSEVLYRMSPDWSEMRQLRGGGFLADTRAPNRNWLQEYILPEDQPHVTAVINEAIRAKSIFELEHRVRRVDGSLGWTLSRAIPVQDANGQIVEWFGAASDITQRKQAEEALRESDERFRSLADGCPAIIWVTDAEGKNRFVNRTFREFFDVDYEQVEGHKWHALVHPDDAPEYMGAFLRAIRERAPFSAETRLRRADGEWRWVASHAEPRFSESGEFLGHAGISPDITERKQAEQALAEAIQRLNAHMDNSPLAVIEFDSQLRVTRWSEEARRIFGWRTEEILGRAASEVRWVHEDDADAARRITQAMFDGTRPRNLITNRNYRKDGSVVECEWYNSAIYDRGGRLTSILSQVVDVTDRKRTEERLRQVQKSESVGLLAGGIAHDFNNLLTGIMGNASMVLDELGPGPAARVNEVIHAAERAAGLTRQLLAYSGKGQFIVRDIDVSQAVNEMADLAQLSIPPSVDLALNVQRRLPAVRMDPSQLQQILMNLVTNAGEAIGEGNPGKITVATSMTDVEKPFVDAIGQEIAAGRYVTIEVSDTGGGIDEEKLSKIFDPFFTTKFTGRGLGLAAVAGILRSQQGGITVQSAPGKGSTFRVLLRAVELRREELPRQPEAKRRGAILVVDDDASVREFISAALQHEGYRILEAVDGKHALATFDQEKGKIDAVVLDVVMPGMSANDLLPELIAREPHLRILLTTGYSESEARRLCAAHPGVALIQKPYTAQQLLAALEGVLQPSKSGDD